MMALAVSECGLTLDQFLELSWFEWSLYANKIARDSEKEKARQEAEWARTRIIWAMMANSMRDVKAKPEPYKPEDLIKLSFDKEEPSEPVQEITFEEAKRRLGSTIKKKDGNQ